MSEKPIRIKDGRFGAYVTDGEVNATLRRTDSVEAMTPERAAELLAESDLPETERQRFVGNVQLQSERLQTLIDKLLRLARKYCTEEQRRELLCNIVEEAKYRSDILDELDSLISKGRMLFHAIFGKQWPTDIISASGYNAIDKQRKQLSAYAEVIAGERWEG